MIETLWILRIHSCFSISDTNLYYRTMAQKGYVLKECRFLFDCFKKEQPTSVYYSAIPKECTTISKEYMQWQGWEFAAQNHKYDIYDSPVPVSRPVPFEPVDIQSFPMLELLVLIFFPAMFYSLWLYTGRLNSNALDTFYWLACIGIYAGFLWSMLMESTELFLIKRKKRFFHQSRIRFTSSCIMTGISNLSHVVFFIFFVFMPYLRAPHI